jgi:hypothetical protein
MHNEARLATAYLRANGTLSESNEQENYAGEAAIDGNAGHAVAATAPSVRWAC